MAGASPQRPRGASMRRIGRRKGCNRIASMAGESKNWKKKSRPAPEVAVTASSLDKIRVACWTTMGRDWLAVLLVLLHGAQAFHVPAAVQSRWRHQVGGPVASRGRVRLGLRPLRMMSGMSFVPDKKAMEENFAKTPDHIVLRDPVELLDPSTKEKATVHSSGACVTSYVTGAGYDVLFRRPDAVFDGSKPISGGVPLCWPQFGPGDIQQHGFARNLKWECVDVREENGMSMKQGTQRHLRACTPCNRDRTY